MSESQFSFDSKLVLRNDAAVFPWVMAVFFNVGVILMTLIVVRDGLPADMNALFSLGMLVFFWTGAIGLALWAYRLKRICLEVEEGQGRLIQASPFRAEVTQFSAQDVACIEVVESTDSDGDPYFFCVLVLHRMKGVKVAEGRDRKTLESAAWRLRHALGLN